MVIVACIDPLSLCSLQYIKMLTRTLCHSHCSVLKILKPLLYNTCTFILPRAHLCSCVPCCIVNVSISLYGGLCLLLCIVRCMHGESDFYQYAWCVRVLPVCYQRVWSVKTQRGPTLQGSATAIVEDLQGIGNNYLLHLHTTYILSSEVQAASKHSASHKRYKNTQTSKVLIDHKLTRQRN